MSFFQTMGMSSIPLVAAFFIGIMTAMSPCPLATNITAIAYISRRMDDSRYTLLVGLLYGMGRMVAYIALAAVIVYAGLNVQAVSFFLQDYGAVLLGPLLIVLGILMLDLVDLNLPGSGKRLTQVMEMLSEKGKVGSFLLGMLFALSFCPFSAVLFFGMLIPLAVRTGDALLVPGVFGIATALPVMVVSVLLVRGIGQVARLLQRAQEVDLWVKRGVAAVFITIGIYSVLDVWVI
ncbi:MAG: aromatic aminobenezylarsenical efflux permease ArsG family transporter [Methanomicrobiaceae archaeon]|nr:aromatic aminobenezylarsenical efflux permease ArsG family transporter [Methanomicrobiaceae archaeon]